MVAVVSALTATPLTAVARIVPALSTFTESSTEAIAALPPNIIPLAAFPTAIGPLATTPPLAAPVPSTVPLLAKNAPKDALIATPVSAVARITPALKTATGPETPTPNLSPMINPVELLVTSTSALFAIPAEIAIESHSGRRNRTAICQFDISSGGNCRAARTVCLNGAGIRSQDSIYGRHGRRRGRYRAGVPEDSAVGRVDRDIARRVNGAGIGDIDKARLNGYGAGSIGLDHTAGGIGHGRGRRADTGAICARRLNQSGIGNRGQCARLDGGTTRTIGLYRTASGIDDRGGRLGLDGVTVRNRLPESYRCYR